MRVISSPCLRPAPDQAFCDIDRPWGESGENRLAAGRCLASAATGPSEFAWLRPGTAGGRARPGPDRGDDRTESNRRSQPRPPYAARLDQGLAVGAPHRPAEAMLSAPIRVGRFPARRPVAGRVAPHWSEPVLRCRGGAPGGGPRGFPAARWTRTRAVSGPPGFPVQDGVWDARRTVRSTAGAVLGSGVSEPRQHLCRAGRALRRGPEAFSATSPRCPAGPNLEPSKR